MRVTGLAAGMGGNWEAALLHYRSLDVPFTFPLQICIPHYIHALTRVLRGLEQSNQAVHDHRDEQHLRTASFLEKGISVKYGPKKARVSWLQASRLLPPVLCV